MIPAPETRGGWARAALLEYGNFLFRYRNLVFPAVLLLFLAGFRPHYFWGDARLDVVSDLVGVLIGLAGLALRSTVVGLVYIKRGGVNRKIYAKDLVTEGMFAHCRNPLYVGNLLTVLGLFVIFNNPWVYGLGGAFYLTAYIAIVAAEERYLHGMFGAAYQEYCRQVPRWRIEWRGFRATLGQHRFNWRRAVVKEYSTIGTFILMNLAVFATEAYVNEGLHGSQTDLAFAGAGAVLTAILVLTVRTLKKSGRLTVP